MALATFNSAVRAANPKPRNIRPKPEIRNPFPSVFGFRASFYFGPLGLIGSLALVFLMIQSTLLRGQETNAAMLARTAFEQTKKEYNGHAEDPQSAWHLARATFDLADFATNKTERAGLAQQGMAACRQALARTPDSGPLHYYLGLNEGQLARTKSLGALRLVDQMESEFTRAIALDPLFDYAGAERSLGLLYRDAPVLGSIGSRSKAKRHLERAVELAPQFPENRLNLVESELKWGDRRSARHELKLLEDALPAARTQFAGSTWASSWADWEARLDKAKKTLEEPVRLETTHH